MIKLKKRETEMLILYVCLSLIPGIVLGLYHGFDVGLVMFVICATLSIITVYGCHYYFERDKKK